MWRDMTPTPFTVSSEGSLSSSKVPRNCTRLPSEQRSSFSTAVSGISNPGYQSSPLPVAGELYLPEMQKPSLAPLRDQAGLGLPVDVLFRLRCLANYFAFALLNE